MCLFFPRQCMVILLPTHTYILTMGYLCFRLRLGMHGSIPPQVKKRVQFDQMVSRLSCCVKVQYKRWNHWTGTPFSSLHLGFFLVLGFIQCYLGHAIYRGSHSIGLENMESLLQFDLRAKFSFPKGLAHGLGKNR